MAAVITNANRLRFFEPQSFWRSCCGGFYGGGMRPNSTRSRRPCGMFPGWV